MTVPQSQRFSQRQTMRRNDFEAFFYSDDYIREVAMHHHDFYEIYLFLSGRVRYTVESRHYDLMPGDILLISPQELHQPVFSREEQAPYSRIVIWIDGDWIRRIGSLYACDPTCCFDVADPAHTNLLRLSGAERKPVFDLALSIIGREETDDAFSELLAAVQLLELLVRLNRLRARERARGGREPALSGTLETVVGYINANLTERLTLDRLAEHHYISKYHLSHLFQRAMGTSVFRYITQKRLILARQLLLTDMPLRQIYTRCGFATYSSFYRAFRGVYGISPRDYRRSVSEPRQT